MFDINVNTHMKSKSDYEKNNNKIMLDMFPSMITGTQTILTENEYAASEIDSVYNNQWNENSAFLSFEPHTCFHCSF